MPAPAPHTALIGGVRLWWRDDPAPTLFLISTTDPQVALEIAAMSSPRPTAFSPASSNPDLPDGIGTHLFEAPDPRLSWPGQTALWSTLRMVLDVDLLTDAVHALERIAEMGFSQMLDAQVRAQACSSNTNLFHLTWTVRGHSPAPTGRSARGRSQTHHIWL